MNTRTNNLQNNILFWLAVLTFEAVALDTLKNLNELQDLDVLGLSITEEAQQIFWIIIFFINLILIIYLVLSKIKVIRRIREIEKAAAGNNYAIATLLLERCQKLVSNGDIDTIIDKHQENVSNKINTVKQRVDNKIHDVINDNFFNQALAALKNKKSKRGFDPVLSKAYNELVGKIELDQYIKKEYNSLLTEISNYVTKWLRDEDISQYLKVTEGLQTQMLNLKKDIAARLYFYFNPKVEDLISLDYEKIILATAALIPAFKVFSERVSTNYGTTKVAALGIFMDDFGIDDLEYPDISDLDIDIAGYDFGIGEEIGEQVASELFEYVGAAIPYIGLAFIAIKAIRYFNLFTKIVNKPNKVREMRQKVHAQISQFLNSYEQKNLQEIERSSLKLVSVLKDEFSDIQKAAERRMK